MYRQTVINRREYATQGERAPGVHCQIRRSTAMALLLLFLAADSAFLPAGACAIAKNTESNKGARIRFVQQARPAKPSGVEPELIAQPPTPNELLTSPTPDKLEQVDQAWFDEDRKPIRSLGLNITPSDGDMPANVAGQLQDQPQIVEGARPAMPPLRYTYGWPASNICHHPLYFEEPGVERYGHSHGVLQPVVSGVHFFSNVALLPARMVVHPPSSCVCGAGTRYCTPSPFLRNHPAARIGAGAAKSGFVTTLMFLP